MPLKCHQRFLAFEDRTSLQQRSTFFLSLTERMPHAHLRLTSLLAPGSSTLNIALRCRQTRHGTTGGEAGRRGREGGGVIKFEISSMQSIAAGSALIASESPSLPSLSRARHNAVEARWHVLRKREGIIGQVNFKLF